jgi:prevent-host-death family protein
MEMKRVQSKDFSNAIGAYLQRASRGETFLITSYGRPYVVLGPPPAEVEESEESSPQK